MAHILRAKPRRLSQPRMSLFANLGRDLETEARMIVAWLWAPLKMGLESMLRFGLRSSVTTMIVDRSAGHSPGLISLRPNSHDGADRKPASASTPVPICAPRPMPKRFHAARHGDE
jgi:hypothetical protein